jgi:hypothetical protein
MNTHWQRLPAFTWAHELFGFNLIISAVETYAARRQAVATLVFVIVRGNGGGSWGDSRKSFGIMHPEKAVVE